MVRGRERRFSSAHAIAALSLCLALVLAAISPAAGEAPASFSDGNARMTLEALVFASRLPSAQPAPADLIVSTRVSSQEGGHPPALEQLSLEAGRHLSFDFKKVPVCHYARTRDTNTDWDRCSRAVVGNGMIEFEIAFPEQKPISADGNVLIYNGGLVRGKRRLWLRFPVTIPTETIVVDPLDIARAGNGASRLSLSISRVAGGSGFLTDLVLRLRKGVLAACAADRLRFRVAGTFADGSHPQGQLTRRCSRS